MASARTAQYSDHTAPPWSGSRSVQTTDENGWVDRMMNPRVGAADYQNLKFALHRKLLGRVHLESVLALPEDRVRSEIRGVLAILLDEEDAPLNAIERQRILDEVLDEVFGLGPLEPLLQDPTVSDILVTNPRLVIIHITG